MKRLHSIRARLALVFLFLFMLFAALGYQALRGLRDVGASATQLRLRWLPSTRALGDLNNFTTDFPPLQAALALTDSARERAAFAGQLTQLDRDIAAAQRAYRDIAHDDSEDQMFARFAADWSTYRQTATQAAYDAASWALGALTQRNIEGAREASLRSDLAYRQARQRIAIAIALAGLMMAVALLYVTRSISAPLVDLAARMHRLADSETRIEVKGTRRRDEIGEMARAVVVFRNNAVDLAASRQALTQQAEVLREKLQEEQRLTLLQRNFVSMASHEFRTPLAIIDGHAQRLTSMRERLTAPELAERAGRMRDMVLRMTQLIDNLIGSTRLIDGGIGLNFHPAPLNLRALLREECRLQRELMPDAHIQEPDEAPPLMVQGDAMLLGQAFGNLLSNAVKYSPDGGLIRVDAGRLEEHIIVMIEDHGIGIPAGDRQRVFERYYRGSNTSGIVGSGVGLYLVKAIVELHQGAIALESREGPGVRFTVQLPVSVEVRRPLAIS
jgi:two-component system OmpR family sensor kinase